ncbi:MAG: hypothetical protein NT031_20315 [Planctomycetota bacterium]|nr:hypothetical protein [Planctomycetota bacterium]
MPKVLAKPIGQRRVCRPGIADLTALTAVCRLGSRLAGRALALDRPLVGRYAFAHESGIHVRGVLGDPASYEPLPPLLAAGQRRALECRRPIGPRQLQRLPAKLRLRVPA